MEIQWKILLYEIQRGTIVENLKVFFIFLSLWKMKKSISSFFLQIFIDSAQRLVMYINQTWCNNKYSVNLLYSVRIFGLN
jgi:hypothetical protein